ncbi:integrase, catalytic region, zinc finger, CCHC-type containing protein [Tanacetum coccineum]
MDHKLSNSPILRSDSNADVQIVLWYLDLGCSKHMTGDRSRLKKFMKKFIGTIRFGNDHFGAIMGYGDYVIGDCVISRVYYVEGLGHNLFSVGQFCYSDLEVAFRKHSCYVRDTDDVELIKGSRGSNLYTISIEDMMKSSPIYLLSKASKNKSRLWHRRLNHLNFGTINDLDSTAERHYRKMESDSCGGCSDNADIFQGSNVSMGRSRCTQNQYLINTRHTKTPCELVHDRKPDLTFFRVFGALCYPTNDSEDLGKLQPIADIGIFIGYAPSRKGYRIYNKRTQRIMETIHVQFNELSEPMAPMQLSTGLVPTFLTPGQIKPRRVKRLVSPAPTVPVLINSASTPSSTTIDQEAPSLSHSPSSSALQSPSSHQGVSAGSIIIQDNPFAHVDNNPFINVFSLESSSKTSSSWDGRSADRINSFYLLNHFNISRNRSKVAA